QEMALIPNANDEVIPSDVIRVRIGDVAMLDTMGVCSPVKEIHGFEWKVNLYNQMDRLMMHLSI
ncbi:hypothetical protein PFISCL1PPCAC_21154, partial [Pristionchus fissidentatus]